MRPKRFIWLALLLLLGAGVVILSGTWPGEDGPGSGPGRSGAPAKTVSVATVAVSTVTEHLQVTGTVVARESVTVTTETSGVVHEVLFEDGQTVAAGLPLLRLDDGEEAAELAAARAELSASQRAFDRATELRRRETVAQATFDQAAAAVEAARAAVAAAQARLDERTVRAPFAGRLGFRAVSPGAYLQPGDEVTTLDDVARVHVEFMVPETRLSEITVGQTVAFAPEGEKGPEVVARVGSLSPRVDPATRQARVRATLDNPDGRLRPGQLVIAVVALDEHQGIVVPGPAIVSVGYQHFAFVAADGRALRREVGLGWRGDGRIEVVHGLQPGETVVIEGAAKLSDGDAVTVVPPRAVAPSGRPAVAENEP